MRPFTQTLDQLRFGTLTDDLTKALNELTIKCGDTGRSGELTLKLVLKPGKAGQIEIVDDIKVKMPKDEKGSTIMFATVEGNLTREDPRQMQLEGLRTVDSKTGELKRVGGA
jgi:hypothetical protein